jgi:hypothetical protein
MHLKLDVNCGSQHLIWMTCRLGWCHLEAISLIGIGVMSFSDLATHFPAADTALKGLIKSKSAPH